MTINELITKAHAQAKAAGFWDQERNTGELLMLIVSECGEALEAHRKGRRADLLSFGLDGPSSFKEHIGSSFEDELADIVIRIADLCGRHDFVMSPYNTMGDKNANVGEALLNIVRSVVGEDDEPSVVGLNNTISMCWGLANAHNIDLDRHIELKLAYNATRPRLHGKAY